MFLNPLSIMLKISGNTAILLDSTVLLQHCLFNLCQSETPQANSQQTATLQILLTIAFLFPRHLTCRQFASFFTDKISKLHLSLTSNTITSSLHLLSPTATPVDWFYLPGLISLVPAHLGSPRQNPRGP